MWLAVAVWLPVPYLRLLLGRIDLGRKQVKWEDPFPTQFSVSEKLLQRAWQVCGSFHHLQIPVIKEWFQVDLAARHLWQIPVTLGYRSFTLGGSNNWESNTSPPTPCLHARVHICPPPHTHLHTFTKLLLQSTEVSPGGVEKSLKIGNTLPLSRSWDSV